jgi:molecular chaperone GrpE
MPEPNDTTAKTRGPAPPEGDRPTLKVEDKRHWARKLEEEAGTASEGEEAEEAPSLHPTIVDAYRTRADAAEKKLHEYIAAFKQSQADHEEFRARLSRDVDRKIETQFGILVTELLETVDDLDLALSHVEGIPEAEPLARGVGLARDRFLASLERQGVVRVILDGEEFDPNVAEAVQVVDAADPAQDGKVVSTVRAGYRLGDRVIRPARVRVGRHRAPS